MKYFYLKDVKAYFDFCQSDMLWQKHLLAIADDALNQTFTFTDKYEMERCTTPVHFDGAIDWDYIPFGDNEWCFAFNRHTFLLNLAKAYGVTGEEKYREGWIRLFEAFYENSKLNDNTRNLSWRSLECGIRIENYIRSIEIFNAIKPLPQEVLVKIDSFFEAHIEYLLSTHTAFHRMSNWGVLQDHGLFLAAIYLGNEEAAKEALDRLTEELTFQCMSDGVHYEQSPMYQAEVLHAVLDTLLIAKRNNSIIPEKLLEKAHLLSLGLARMLRPDGNCYLFGDSDEIDFSDIIARAAVLFEDSELALYGRKGLNEEFYASFPLDQKLPEPMEVKDRSRFFQATGNAILALNKETEVRFHAGLIGSGHGHIDQLHFDLYSKGNVLLTDTGRYTYVDTPERRALKGARGHNTILVNDTDFTHMVDSWRVSDMAEAIFSEAVMDGKYKFVSASHLGYINKGVFVTRNIVTLEDRFIVLFDVIRSKDEAEAEILFHTDADVNLIATADGFKLEKGESYARLHFLSEGETKLSKYPLSLHYNELLESDLISRVCKVKGSHIAVTIISLDKEETEIKAIPVTKSLSGLTLSDDIAKGLQIGEYTLAFIANEYPDGGFLLKAGDSECYGHLFLQKKGEEVVTLKY